MIPGAAREARYANPPPGICPTRIHPSGNARRALTTPPLPMPIRLTALLALALAAGGCTSFATVRSAEVVAGPSVMLQGSITSPPGDDAAWFWSYDCASSCDHAISTLDASFTYGWVDERPYSLGVGISGLIFPYIEGYWQLNGDSTRAYGLGGRLGVPVIGWSSHQLYFRYDIPFSGDRRLLLSPALFFHAGASPNGENSGYFAAFVQSVGLEHRAERATVVQSVALVAGRGDRDTFGDGGPFTTVFGTASMSVTFHRRRPRP